MEIEDFIRQSIDEGDLIEAISDALPGYFEAGISPEVCALLFQPLVVHALKSAQLDQSIAIYSRVMADIYAYIITKDVTNNRSIFQESIQLIKDIMDVQRKKTIQTNYEFDLQKLEMKELLNLVAISVNTCSLILSTEEYPEFDSYLYILWDNLSNILKFTLFEINDTTIIIIKAVAGISKICISECLTETDELTISNLLASILRVMNHQNILEDLLVDLSNTVSHIIQSYPDLTIHDTSYLALLTNLYSQKIKKNPDLVKIRAILNLSCLLVQNYTKAPWIPDILLLVNEIERDQEVQSINILKEKYTLLLKEIEEPDDLTNHLEAMDIDDELSMYLSQNLMVTSDETHKVLLSKVKDIIYELTSQNQDSNRSRILLSQLRDISIYTRTIDMSVICKAYMKDIVQFVTRMLVIDPALTENVTQLFGYQIPNFLSTYLNIALPFAVAYTEDDDALSGIAASLELSILSLCKSGAHYILVSLLMEKDANIKAYGYKRLQTIFANKSIVKTLISENLTKITTTLAMSLGVPGLQESSMNALNELKTLTGNTKENLSDYLSSYFIAILERVSRFISEKRNQVLKIQDPYALEALSVIMSLLDSNISNHTLHLMKVFHTLKELPNMQFQVCSLWEKFISLLDTDTILSHVNGIVKNLIDIMPIATKEIRVTIAKLLYNLLVEKNNLEPGHYTNLPILPDYEEFQELKEYIASNKQTKKPSNYEFKQIIATFSNANSDDVQVLLGLQRLRILLENYPECEVYRNQIFSNLFYLLRKYASHKQITYLAALCLGKLGAVDPSTVNMPIIEDTVFIMNNFHRQDENLDFISDLIINHIYPAYNAINDEQVRKCTEFTIQTLLHQAGYHPVHEMKKRPSLIAIFHHWRRLPTSIQEFLTPFLQSAYQGTWSEHASKYPIFPNAKSFEEWAQDWYCVMANSAHDTAKQIFAACIPIVRSSILEVTLHLLPYLVLHLLLSGTPSDIRHIVDELMIVFSMNSKPHGNHSSQDKMNVYSLQVAVAVTEYCRKWLNRVGPYDAEKRNQVSRVNSFLELIPNKVMGIAAFYTKAYPQALMEFETHFKKQKTKIVGDHEMLDYLRQIYIQIDDPVDLQALMDMYTSVLSRDEEITRFEALGKWDEAEALYKSKISDNPYELAPYIGYMECLRKCNNYEKLLYVTEKVFKDIPKWSPQINSFRIDSAWRVQDWDTLETAVNQPMERNSQALIGCILSKMLQKQNLEAASLIEEARHNIIEQLTMSNTSKSYRKSYPLLFSLQLLQELEDSQKVWDSDKPFEYLEWLDGVWKSSSRRVRPRTQYNLHLLELRKTAFYDIRLENKDKAIGSKLWLNLAKADRKMGNMAASFNAILQAEKLSDGSLHRERAKWYWKNGNIEKAINILLSKAQVSKKCEDISKLSPEDILLWTDIAREKPSVLPFFKSRAIFAILYSSNASIRLEKANYNVCAYYSHHASETSGNSESKLKIQIYVIKTAARALETGSKYYYISMSNMINTYLDVVKQTLLANSSKSTYIKNVLKIYAPKVDQAFKKAIDDIPAYQFSLFLTRLISHLSIDLTQPAELIQNLISKVFEAYPRNTIWHMLSAIDSESRNVSRRMNVIFDKAKQAIALKNALDILSELKTDKTMAGQLSLSQMDNPLLKLKDLELYMPNEACLIPKLPEIIRKGAKNEVFANDSPTIRSFGNKITVMKSLQKPKKITVYGSDGQTYAFLLKREDDLRKDARTMEFNYMINSFMKRDPESRDKGLYIRTYAVVPLGTRWGLIEWINDLNSLKNIVNDIWESQGLPSVTSISIKLTNAKLSLGAEKVRYFVEKVLPMCPPVFYKWFLKNFPEPNYWLASRTRYVKTLAVMSIVGHLIGLGDRHAENILFDEKSGDCVHVDLNMLFGKGQKLPVPELVPFRLTHNLVDAMGVLGHKGLFQNICEATYSVLLENKESLLSVFRTFLSEVDATTVVHSKSTRSTQTSREDFFTEVEQKFNVQPSHIKTEVQNLIQKATDTANLSQMFPGWAPFV
ncbi:uncharacterized protein BX663DRAFT_552745 [Cokeromyces recurvatus]|uniref:uncharacterized protein n=1 Tax=Cokeromyces recurvatus TaxID=90255 RepID=UPI002220D782|nr:uncharacterized protein BX663DRAFT_552745 [Cokeromyces recurvatus]KAI7901832.1 hypothetical protein BX663DRAFT_552745 [Cokeromyces recurvatus]